jgi:hypothetical protein
MTTSFIADAGTFEIRDAPRRIVSGTAADRLFAGLARGAALLTLALLSGIIVSLVVGAWPAPSARMAPAF